MWTGNGAQVGMATAAMMLLDLIISEINSDRPYADFTGNGRQTAFGTCDRKPAWRRVLSGPMTRR
jgi:hypothetical protein